MLGPNGAGKSTLLHVATGLMRPASGDATYDGEPLAAFDVHYQLHLLDVARGLLEGRCTVVAILHDLDVALRYGDHFVLLDGGRVAWNGERADEIPLPVLERVFRVKARHVGRAGEDGPLLQFTL